MMFQSANCTVVSCCLGSRFGLRAFALVFGLVGVRCHGFRLMISHLARFCTLLDADLRSKVLFTCSRSRCQASTSHRCWLGGLQELSVRTQRPCRRRGHSITCKRSQASHCAGPSDDGLAQSHDISRVLQRSLCRGHRLQMREGVPY